jgi:hypothetical protein
MCSSHMRFQLDMQFRVHVYAGLRIQLEPQARCGRRAESKKKKSKDKPSQGKKAEGVGVGDGRSAGAVRGWG